MTPELARAVDGMTAATWSLDDDVLGSDAWTWGPYDEVRFAHLQTALELDELSARLRAQRGNSALALTEAQIILGEHQRAYRALRAHAIGLDDEDFDREPAPGEWPFRGVLRHAMFAERYFLGTILFTLASDKPPEQAPDEEQRAALLQDEAPDESASQEEMWSSYAELHERVLSDLSGLSDSDLDLLAPMWEPQRYPIRFRMHRFAAHLREHTNQAGKTIRGIGRPPTESVMLLTQTHDALATVEGACIGAPELAAQSDDLAAQIERRTAEVTAAVRGG